MAGILSKMFKGSPDEADAGTLAAAISSLEQARETARAQEQQLSAARVEALLTDDDGKIDAIEKDLAAVQRQLDRFEVQLPELRRIHAAQAESECFAVNSAKLAAAIDLRISAAGEVDAALISLGKALEKLDVAGADLTMLQNFHGATMGTDGAVEIGRVSPVHLGKAVALFAPSLIRPLGLTKYPGDRKPLAEMESVFWQGVNARVQGKLK